MIVYVNNSIDDKKEPADFESVRLFDAMIQATSNQILIVVSEHLHFSMIQ